MRKGYLIFGNFFLPESSVNRLKNITFHGSGKSSSLDKTSDYLFLNLVKLLNKRKNRIYSSFSFLAAVTPKYKTLNAPDTNERFVDVPALAQLSIRGTLESNWGT